MKDTDLKNRFSKWQMKQIDYLTFNINLILTISLAIIGFIYTSKNDENLGLCCIKCSKSHISIILFLIIITIGIILNYIRFYNIKYTKDIVKLKKNLNITNQDTISIKNKINNLQCLTNVLGTASLIMFSIMTLLFIISIWTLI